MIEETIKTPFSNIYNNFLGKVTDDMYMELTQAETYKLTQELLLSAIHKFEFPRVDLTNYTVKEETITDLDTGEVTVVNIEEFNIELSPEEINILSTYMIVEWLGQQLASVENVRMKYSGSDFKFTSQANHMQKLLVLKQDYEREGFHLQRLYKRRLRDQETGIVKSTFGSIMSGEVE